MTEGEDGDDACSVSSPSVWQVPATSPWQGRIFSHRYVSSVVSFTLLGSFFPLVRREGSWTGFFFFHCANVIGPSGVSMIVSSIELMQCLRQAQRTAAKGGPSKGVFTLI